MALFNLRNIEFRKPQVFNRTGYDNLADAHAELQRKYRAEVKAHAETRDKLTEAESHNAAEDARQERIQRAMPTRDCPSCGDSYPDGPVFFPGYLSGGHPYCRNCSA